MAYRVDARETAAADATVAVKKAWHKPNVYVLTELSTISGAPTNKDHGDDPDLWENESHPDPTLRQKRYRPMSA